MPSSAGCFQEISTLYYRQWRPPHIHSHHARYQRKRAAVNMERHSRSKRHSRVCSPVALPKRDWPIRGFHFDGLTPGTSIATGWHGHWQCPCVEYYEIPGKLKNLKHETHTETNLFIKVGTKHLQFWKVKSYQLSCLQMDVLSDGHHCHRSAGPFWSVVLLEEQRAFARYALSFPEKSPSQTQVQTQVQTSS